MNWYKIAQSKNRFAVQKSEDGRYYVVKLLPQGQGQEAYKKWRTI